MLSRLGRWCARHNRLVIALWLTFTATAALVENGFHGSTHDVFSVPGSDSQSAIDLLTAEFPAAAGTNATVVFRSPDGSSLYTPAYHDAIEATLANVRRLPNVTATVDPFADQVVSLTPEAGGEIGGVITPTVARLYMSERETTAYSTVSYGVPVTSLSAADFDALEGATRTAREAGLDVELGGAVPDAFNAPPPGLSKYSDLIGLSLAVLILLVALGSVTSMAVPIGTALIALSTAHNLLSIAMRWMTIGSVAPILGTMIGLGVGIDYSLFIVSRHRQNLAKGMEPEEAVGAAIGTSGAAVLFAAITVSFALCGLAVVGIPYLGMLGFVAAGYVAVTVVAALTLVPAVLGLLGNRVNSLRIHRRDETADTSRSLSSRWAQVTARRPVFTAIAALLVLIALAAPVAGMRLGFLDDSDLPAELTQHKAYEAIAGDFGPGQTGPLVIAVELPPIGTDDFFEISDVAGAFVRLGEALTDTPGVSFVSLPLPNRLAADGPPPTAAIIQVVPESAPNAEETKRLVRTLRSETIPLSLSGSALDPDHVYIGGSTAVLLDLTDAISSRLIRYIAVVVLLSFLLLMLVFRSLYVPASAAVMNLLSIGAAYGILVAVFQHGWGMRLIGLEQTVPIVAFVPVMMFAILFGLSMDYEVFLISRIRDEYDTTGDNRESVVSGLGATARVITSAALIMMSVFLAFVANPDPTVKMIGLGMAAAVLVDSTVIRMMLVPSTLVLGKEWTWRLPERLDSALPVINIEGGPSPEEAVDPDLVEDYDGRPIRMSEIDGAPEAGPGEVDITDDLEEEE